MTDLRHRKTNSAQSTHDAPQAQRQSSAGSVDTAIPAPFTPRWFGTVISRLLGTGMMVAGIGKFTGHFTFVLHKAELDDDEYAPVFHKAACVILVLGGLNLLLASLPPVKHKTVEDIYLTPQEIEEAAKRGKKGE